MLDIEYAISFKRDVKRAASQGRDIWKMFVPTAMLLNGQPLPEQYRDHPLKGEWAGHREFHVEPNWIVIYSTTAKILKMERTGTHTELFGK
jgi:mRNA interferase YafQ